MILAHQIDHIINHFLKRLDLFSRIDISFSECQLSQIQNTRKKLLEDIEFRRCHPGQVDILSVQIISGFTDIGRIVAESFKLDNQFVIFIENRGMVLGGQLRIELADIGGNAVSQKIDILL